MKARVIATGDIVDVHRLCMSSQGEIWQKKSGREYFAHELDFDVKEPPKPRYNPDYWTRLEHQYAGMAMQGIVKSAYNAYCDNCANYENMIFEDAQALLKDHAEILADVCVEFAHALVEKLKESK